MGPPITFMVDNKQYIAVAGGSGPRGQRGRAVLVALVVDPADPARPGAGPGVPELFLQRLLPPPARQPGDNEDAAPVDPPRCARGPCGAPRAASPLRVRARRKAENPTPEFLPLLLQAADLVGSALPVAGPEHRQRPVELLPTPAPTPAGGGGRGQ